MFDYTLAHWSTFFIAALLLNLSPGPDIAFILAQTVRNGQRSGFAAMFGIWSGTFLHVLLAAIGLSAILATSATIFSLVKWMGALYLIWLGIQSFRSNAVSYSFDSKIKKLSNIKIFRQGFFVSALNPKVAIFFLAFLPQFVVEGRGTVSTQLFLHGFLIIGVAAFIEPPLVILGAKLSKYLSNKSKDSKVATWINRGLGTLFIGLGIRLALSD